MKTFMGNNHKPGFLKIFFIGFLVYLLGGFPTLAFALPQGGSVVSGDATIDSTSQDMVINQDTNKLIVNWDSFDINTTESVQFIQPGSGSIALNRVFGIDPSLILGTLTANGQVFIVNPSGVFFGPNARVDVHGLLATTLQISNQDFLNGQYNFYQDPNFSLASVINQGEITVSGYVGLLAPAVINEGTIVANLGSIALGSAEAATVDFSGDGLINFMLTQEVSGTVTDADGNIIDDRVSNSGLIQADGGQVILTAKDAGDVIRKVVNNTGIIEAHTVEEREGRIFLSGGDSGMVSSSGTLDASGDDAGETGGTVEVLGAEVELIDTANVDVSGDAGGGTALIGGDFLAHAGGAPLRRLHAVPGQSGLLGDAALGAAELITGSRQALDELLALGGIAAAGVKVIPQHDEGGEILLPSDDAVDVVVLLGSQLEIEA
ncbi:MAG: filamentous hemagglutinin N-terminal domain-containing protein, partial [Nitrospinae bacterium]|nr:filamentous hemagglutinin N-terminal domain-containing protein [Nitrospinota bacterium]